MPKRKPPSQRPERPRLERQHGEDGGGEDWELGKHRPIGTMLDSRIREKHGVLKQAYIKLYEELFSHHPKGLPQGLIFYENWFNKDKIIICFVWAVRNPDGTYLDGFHLPVSGQSPSEVVAQLLGSPQSDRTISDYQHKSK